MSKTKHWFDIDKKGLAQILARKGKEFAIFELVQNAWDEEGVTETAVSLYPDEEPGHVFLSVVDNSVHGFRNLTDAYTLFASSRKKGNPQQRGRFNLGEKLVLALCKEACVVTTSGTVYFGDEGRSFSKKHRRNEGSEIQAVFRMSAHEIEHANEAAFRLIPPPGIATVINLKLLQAPPRVASFDASLMTEIANGEGALVRVTRKTAVDVYAADEKHPAAIYEMGIPICEIEGKYCFNVMQKIPLTLDREEVLPAFRKQLAVAALNNMANLIDTEDVNTGWATEATTSPDAEDFALTTYMTKRFGEKRVSFDPSDPEANHAAAAAGYTVITGSQLSKAAWTNVKAANAVTPAGQVFPSPKPFDKDGEPLPLAEMTAKLRQVEDYAKRFAKVVCGIKVDVIFGKKVSWPYLAVYGNKTLTFNVGVLGIDWFDMTTNQCAIDDLLIHEFGHEYCASHLDKKYNDALSGIGSRLASAIRAGLI